MPNTKNSSVLTLLILTLLAFPIENPSLNKLSEKDTSSSARQQTMKTNACIIDYCTT